MASALETDRILKRSSWVDFLKINLFWLVVNIRNNAVGMVFMPYMIAAFVPKENLNAALGGMRTAGLIIAMLVQPAMGLLSDRSTSRFGRRRPFLLVGVLLDLLFLALIGISSSYWMLLAAVLLIQFSGNISHGALQGLIPDLVAEDQRGAASGFKGLMELIPLILVALVVAGLVGAGKFTLAVWVTGGSMLAIALLSLWLVRETPLREASPTPLGPPMLRVLGMLLGIGTGALVGLAAGALLGGAAWLILRSLAAEQTARIVGISLGGLAAMVAAVGAGTWGGVAATLGREVLRKRPSFAWWVTNRLFFYTAVTSIQAFAPYFLMYVFKIGREQAVGMSGQLMSVVGLFTLASALPSGWLADRWGKRRMVMLSGWLSTAGTVMILGMIWAPSLALLTVSGCILGIGVGLFTSSNWALGTELVPRAESGRYLGVSNLAGAGAGMIGTGMGGLIADWLNAYTPGLGYFTLFATFAVLLLLGNLALRGVRQAAAEN